MQEVATVLPTKEKSKTPKVVSQGSHSLCPDCLEPELISVPGNLKIKKGQQNAMVYSKVFTCAHCGYQDERFYYPTN